jgi:hypothetical protein
VAQLLGVRLLGDAMFSSLKKFFGIEPVRETVTIKSGQLFAWRRGIRFQAIEDSEIIFPGEIFREGEEIGSVIEADDDADIGFHQRSDGSFDKIILRLKAGQTATLHRGSQALLGGDVTERVFYVSSAA